MSTLTCPVLVNGEWQAPDGVATSPVYNPSHGQVIAHVPLYGPEMVDAAVQAAHDAFPAWSETPAVERARILFRYKMRLEAEFDALAQSVTREHGKTLAEARGDVRRGIENVEFACGIPSLLMGESLENIARGIDCDSVRQPVGVCAGITPFNFPAMVPLWMFPVALACGNTFVLKPSEKVPLTALRLAELLLESGMPPGVFNMIHGGRECVDALITHPKVSAVSFVGSTPVAKYIYETGIRHGKRVQSAGGAKNFVLIMPDAEVDASSTALIEAAFGCAGERCMAGSTAVAIGDAGKTVLPALVEKAKALRVGPTDVDPEAKMGPVITSQHRDRVCDLVSAAAGEGAKVLSDGRGAKVDKAPNGFYVGATILDGVQPGMTTMKEEVFGPVLNVVRMDNLDAAIELANRSAYGNGAAIFTRSGKAAREFKHRIQAGMVGINIGVPAPMSFFPFSGWNDSFFGDLHLQGKESIQFFTKQKVTTTRWFGATDGDIWQK
ncbi:MAG: CoA-acylating methylmalonate-semialdehyde dehydrogenase [Verrucomicrobium sp.]|nr:CoA-acylating methylmalonate-semialdehyde dehydrogenase [Verrucomicrobium sp.]